MNTLLKLLALTLFLNLVRYLVGGAIEAVLIMEPMHAVMPEYPETFDLDFTTADFMISLFYNFMLWFSAVLIFHFSHHRFRGNMFLKSLKGYGLGCLFFISLAAVYMNHYTADIKVFYLYSMLDALILFLLIAAANSVIYPWLFKSQAAMQSEAV